MPRQVVVELRLDPVSVYSRSISGWMLPGDGPAVRGACAQRARLSCYAAS
jgi:hypothetical protein